MRRNIHLISLPLEQSFVRFAFLRVRCSLPLYNGFETMVWSGPISRGRFASWLNTSSRLVVRL